MDGAKSNIHIILMIKIKRAHQSEEEDSEEDIKRLEDRLQALAFLKDYSSPWPLDADGMPVQAAASGPEALRVSLPSMAVSGSAQEV